MGKGHFTPTRSSYSMALVTDQVFNKEQLKCLAYLIDFGLSKHPIPETELERLSNLVKTALDVIPRLFPQQELFNHHLDIKKLLNDDETVRSKVFAAYVSQSYDEIYQLGMYWLPFMNHTSDST